MNEVSEPTEVPQRKIDRSDQIAREALADALTFFPKWRGDVARFAIRAERLRGEAEREPMLSRCDEIAQEIAEVRADLILDLSEAPQRVAGHSRVVDIERALDNIEATLRDVRARLETGGPTA
jgi:hypothetical protein